jgi:hypothetical protein
MAFWLHRMQWRHNPSGSFTPLAEGSKPITLSGVIDPANPDWSAPSAELLYDTVPSGTYSFSGTVYLCMYECIPDEHCGDFLLAHHVVANVTLCRPGIVDSASELQEH